MLVTVPTVVLVIGLSVGNTSLFLILYLNYLPGVCLGRRQKEPKEPIYHLPRVSYHADLPSLAAHTSYLGNSLFSIK